MEIGHGIAVDFILRFAKCKIGSKSETLVKLEDFVTDLFIEENSSEVTLRT